MKKRIESLRGLCYPLVRIFFIVQLGVMAIFTTTMSAYAHSAVQEASQGIFHDFSCHTTVYSFYQMPSNFAPLHVYFMQATTDAQTTTDMVTVRQMGTNNFVWTLQSTGESFQSAILNPVMGVSHFGVTILQTQQVQAVPSGDDILPAFSPIWAAGMCNTWYADGAKIGGYP